MGDETTARGRGGCTANISPPFRTEIEAAQWVEKRAKREEPSDDEE